VKPTERFSTRVADYVRFRPHYPGAVIDVLVEEVGLTPAWIVADIGSGTGLSAQLFLDNGNTVMAVEPNPDMRAAAESLLDRWPTFQSREGTAEATLLPSASVDLVVAAQAFHWFRVDEARRELRRILKPEGWVALLWNRRRTDATPFLRDYEALLLRYGTDYQEVRHDRVGDVALIHFFAPGYRRRVLYNEQVVDYQGLKGRLLSSSYTPEEGDPHREAMLLELQHLFDRHQQDGSVRIEYDTEVYIGRPQDR
jgi:SAM-dependent methyltransferase